MIQLISILFSVFILAPSLSASDLPRDLSREMKRSLPKAKILAFTPCRMDDAEAFGLLTDGGKGKNPLRPVIFYRKGQTKWRMSEVPISVSNSKGSSNIVSDFWGKEGFKGKYQIRCTTPATDIDINTQANGEYSKEFEKIDASTLHLCFQGSAVYNDWACLTYDKNTDGIRVSFVQINAD